MAWELTDDEYNTVLNMPVADRYDYTMARIIEWGIVWGLASEEGWAAAKDEEGREVMPIWPHERYAALSMQDGWDDTQPQPVELAAWIYEWLPGLENDNVHLAICYLPGSQGAVVTAAHFRNDLADQMETMLELESADEEEA